MYDVLREAVRRQVTSLGVEVHETDTVGRVIASKAAVNACCSLSNLLKDLDQVLRLTSWHVRLKVVREVIETVKVLAECTGESATKRERVAVSQGTREAEAFIEYTVVFAAELEGLFDDEQSGVS